MATRSLLFHSLRRVISKHDKKLQLSQSGNERCSIAKFYSVSSATEESANSEEKDDLRSRIFRLRLPKRSATTVLEKWIVEGNQITASELREISKELRRSQRYKHALEISEWMVQHNEFDMSEADYALRIDLMSKVFGIDAAKRYFEALPQAAKTSDAYTALLHSYAGSKQIDRAEELFKRIKESKGLSFSAIIYNEMMTLYMSVGQIEKVAGVIEELKRQNIPPDIFTYNLWISSCAAALNISEVRRILEEMGRDPGSNETWVRYINLTNIYLTSGRLVNEEPAASPVEAEKGISQREWITYDLLVILYAGLGKKDRIDEIWKSLRMTKRKMTSRNFVCIVSSYLILGHLKEVGDIVDQWKQSTTTEFDSSTCQRILDAFRGVGLTEKADDFYMLLIQRNCSLDNGSE